jgi:hypothetical protein
MSRIFVDPMSGAPAMPGRRHLNNEHVYAKIAQSMEPTAPICFEATVPAEVQRPPAGVRTRWRCPRGR